jgi:hypothetical protein
MIFPENMRFSGSELDRLNIEDVVNEKLAKADLKQLKKEGESDHLKITTQYLTGEAPDLYDAETQ